LKRNGESDKNGSMKKRKLFDWVPTIFGVIAILGAIISSGQPNTGYWSLANIGLVVLYGGAVLSLVSGLATMVTARKRRSLSIAQWVNVFWVILVLLFFALGEYIHLTWKSLY
jgi:hypothetical protein